MPIISSVGLFDPQSNLNLWTIARLLASNSPLLPAILEVPNSLSRVGDLLVWNGHSGQQVIAGLESLSQSTQEITAFAQFQLGFQAISAGMMLAQSAILYRKLDQISDQLAQIKGLITTSYKADIEAALVHLNDFENGIDQDKEKNLKDEKRLVNLDQGLQEAHFLALKSTKVFGQLVEEECGNRKRLEVLAEYGHFFSIALLADIRALMHRGELTLALNRIESEWPRFQKLAQTGFNLTLADRDAALIYLEKSFIEHKITLETFSEVYRQAQSAGVSMVLTKTDLQSVFEFLRPNSGWRKTIRPAWSFRRTAELNQFRSILEDVNRIKAFQLRIEHARSRNYSTEEMEREIRELRRAVQPEDKSKGKPLGDAEILAYEFKF